MAYLVLCECRMDSPLSPFIYIIFTCPDPPREITVVTSPRYTVIGSLLLFLSPMRRVPSVDSCHHGMVRPLVCGWGSRPPDMEVSCEYIE